MFSPSVMLKVKPGKNKINFYTKDANVFVFVRVSLIVELREK